MKALAASSNISPAFLDRLVSSIELDCDSLHGLDHWLRVMHNGRELAAATGANLRVVELFAVLHDSRRQNENDDPEHGHRAAKHAEALRGHWLDLSDSEMDMLVKACRYHSDGLLEAELTVQVCWDADRLDLGRVGIRPRPEYLCTDYAKRQDVIDAAYRRSRYGWAG